MVPPGLKSIVVVQIFRPAVTIGVTAAVFVIPMHMSRPLTKSQPDEIAP